MMINILKSIKNNLLVIISFTLLIIFIWLRILTERLPREIPFNLSTVSIIIIICIILGHFITIISLSKTYILIVIENKYSLNKLNLNKIIALIAESIFKFSRDFGDELNFNLNFLYGFMRTKIIPNIDNKTKYNYVVNYIKIEVLLRVLLNVIFIIDIFYFNVLYYYYYILILLSVFLLIHLFIKNILKAIVSNSRFYLKNELAIVKIVPVEDELGHEKAVSFETGQFGFLTWDHNKFIPYPIIEFEDLIESQTRQHLLKKPLIRYILSNVNRPGIDLGVAKSMLNFAILCHAAFIHIEIRKKNYIYWLIGFHLIQALCWTYVLVYSSYNISEDLFILGILPECFDIKLFL